MKKIKLISVGTGQISQDNFKDYYRSEIVEISERAFDIIHDRNNGSLKYLGWESIESESTPEKIEIEKTVSTESRRDLAALLGCADWELTIRALSALTKKDDAVKAGDYIRLPVKTKKAKHDGLEFAALDIEETELVVVDVTADKIIFNFDEVLFRSAINNKNTNDGGFHAYLNDEFLEDFDLVKDCLQKNKDGDYITLPTAYELFGANDYSNKSANWEEPRQLEYFKKVKNRIRTEDNDTKWWWTSSPYGSTYFCYVSNYGLIYYDYASGTDGGVAPALCI